MGPELFGPAAAGALTGIAQSPQLPQPRASLLILRCIVPGMDTAPDLVLAIPRRELYRVSGFTRKVDFAILDMLADETWFAAPVTLVGNLDAKEVRLGVIAERSGDDGKPQLLVEEAGVLVHAASIPPEAGALGPGLAALRKLALVSGRHLVGVDSGTVELVGYCNDESLPECRSFFLLVYRLRLPAGTPAPASMSWISAANLAGVPLDPVSALIAHGW